MTAEGFVIAFVVGAFASWLIAMIAPHSGLGFVGNLTMAVFGAIVGVGLLPLMGLHLGPGIVTPAINAAIGAALILFVMRLFQSDDTAGETGESKGKQ